VVVGAWQTSGGGTDHDTAPPPKTTHHHRHPTVSGPHAYLQIKAVTGRPSLPVPPNRPGGPLLLQGTPAKGSPPTPFLRRPGKRLWVNVSSPETLVIVVGGKQVPLSGLKPVVLNVTANGVQTA